ncbi:DUF2568 domain-containing protein [Pseudooceanicola sp.]|uniref:DUF2568 domain-containing protein n=1 Tax=Pseudooceanicola sp. TaxID=1914328 RepID=UPI002636778D|nr:DUF2568 domain-containing protein [Pseudooceanicola sp.]MDF1854102.1 DUF2568 domain-containing protein [Pseudooceanicola sp.]
MAPLILINHLLALTLEIALLIGLARVGLALRPGWMGWVLAAILVLIAVALWTRFAAPSSATRLSGSALLGFKSAIFAAGAIGLAWRDGAAVGAVFAALVVLHLALATKLGIL